MDEKKKSVLTDSEIMDYAVQFFLNSLPSLDGTEHDKPEKISCGMTVEELNEAQLKMVGLLSATDEERIQLMMKIMELTEEEATALLNKMQERRRGGD